MTIAPFVIFDSEFTAWEGSLENNWSRPGEYREIIQIAAAIVDPSDQYKIQAEFNILIKPAINSCLSDYIQYLTGIHQKQIDNEGVSFLHAMKAFHLFCKQDKLRTYCWGSDEDKFIETCVINDINFSDYFTHFYDIRDIFKKTNIDTSKYQSGTVYQSMGLTFSEKQHYALSDVRSIVVTLQCLHQNKLITESYFENCSISRSTEAVLAR